MAVATDCLPERDVMRLTKAVWRTLRQFRDALRYRSAESELDVLSERYLRDVGVERRCISKAVEAEITGISMLDTGWAKPRRRFR